MAAGAAYGYCGRNPGSILKRHWRICSWMLQGNHKGDTLVVSNLVSVSVRDVQVRCRSIY